MKIEIQKSTLQNELACVSGIARKGTIPVLSQVAVDALADGTLRISASDLNTSIITESQCTVKQAGSCCIPAGKLQEIVRLASDGIIKINLLDNDWASVVTESSRFKLASSNRESFPELATAPASSLISVPSDILSLLITRASIAMATTDEGRFALQSLKFTVGADGAQMVGTDGHRLAIAKVVLAEEPLDDLDTLVPRAALAELIRLTGEYNGPVTINADENHIFFRFGKRLLISTMLTGEYPNYELLLPKAIQDSVEFNTDRLTLGVRRAALMAQKTSHTIKLAFGDSKLKLSAQDSETGEAVDSVESDNPLALVTAFNYQYMLDFLEVVGSERVVLDLSGAEIQAQMQPVGEADEAYRYVLMPMRVKAKEETA